MVKGWVLNDKGKPVFFLVDGYEHSVSISRMSLAWTYMFKGPHKKTTKEI